MKKRILSWLLVLTMVTSLIPSTLVTALAAELPSVQAATTIRGESLKEKSNEWPTAAELNDYDVVDVSITNTVTPSGTLTVADGQTLIIHGSGTLSGTTRTENTPFLIVESGGHLVLDHVTITGNKSDNGTVVVKSGGLLDLGYNDQRDRVAPSITGNTTTANAAKNLVVADGATVRLNNTANNPIGVTAINADGSAYSGKPISVMRGGRYSIQGNQDTMENMESNVTADAAAFKLYQGTVNSTVSTKESSNVKLVYVNDSLVYVTERKSILIWNPAYFWKDIAKDNSLLRYDKGPFDLMHQSGKDYSLHYKQGSGSKPQHLTDQELNALWQYDTIVLDYPYIDLTTAELTALKNYLNKGGRIFILLEYPSGSLAQTNLARKSETIAKSLNADFTISDNENVNFNADVQVNTESKLTNGISATHKCGNAGYIASTSDSVTWLFKGTTVKGNTSYIACDQFAGEKNNEKWGSLTVCGDGVYFDSSVNQKNIGVQLLSNLTEDARKNRIIAATGVNPNKKIVPQATTTTTVETPYATPYAALIKAEETNTVTLKLTSNTAVTPTTDELLFENATLAYEQGSKYNGSTISADTAGVYVDITQTGEVNLRSGTVTVNPANKDYVLTLGGTGLNAAGSAIEGGYKITASNAYTLDADDSTSKIPAAQGGGASITLEKAGQSVTVEYAGALAGKKITYTAKEDGEKIYLGYYQVYKNAGSNITWTDADYAWHGQTFTTTATANDGWELDGEQLTVADTEGKVVGVYTLEKTGTENNGGNEWTVYSSKEKDRDGNPKVTVKQEHLGGDADRNGKAMVIVNDVRGDVTISAAGDVVSAASAFVYVVGIGRRDGQETQLWEYTTVRNSKNGVTEKPINGWPWEKWKVAEAGSGLGGQNDYQNNTDKFKDSFAKDATKLDTSTATAKYTIDLTLGDQVVVFYYDWNMTEVTIKATDANGDPIPDYTDQVVEYELDKQTTINAPNLIGYQPKADNVTKDFKPTKGGNNTVTFVYEKTTGNLTYRAVYEDSNGVEHELGTFSGGVLVKGQKPAKSAQYAPQFDNYELVNANADGEASADVYNGTDITVTYKYQPKTKDIAVYAYAGDDEATGTILSLDKTSYKGMTTGQTITITAPEIAGYKVKGADSKTFFISNDKSENQDVKFFYEKDDSNEAYVLVQLVDSSNSNKVISEYQVPGIKGKAQLIKAPAAPYGYKDDPASPNEDQTVTLPDTGNAPYTKTVQFKYVPNVHTVTVVLKDVSTDPATILTVNNFMDTYEVVDGESLKITAPSIYGYTMAANAEAVKELKDIKTDTTVTFEYEPIDKQLVTVYVKGVGPGNQTLFENRETVTFGTKSKDVTVFNIPGLKLASATVDGTPATIKSNTLTVDTSKAAKGATITVVVNYESNMANVTVKAMYNGTELQSYTLPLEKGVQATINAPSIEGYTAKSAIQTVTPGDTEAENTVTFTYTKDNGNVTVVVLDAKDQTELYRKDGGTVKNGNAIDLNGKAPTIEYYTAPSAPKSVKVNNQEVKDLTSYKYDGVGDIIVTYEYTRNTQDVTIIKKDVDTGKEITGQSEKLTGLPVGKSHTFTDGSVKVPDHYQAVADRNPDSYFVEDKPNQTVTFWYKNTSADQYVQVTVNLICDDDGTTFQSYPVTAIKGVETTINAPAWTGYELATNESSAKTVTPDGTAANDKVEFHYTIKDPKYVKVELKDNSNNANPDMNTPANYITSYTLKMGDSVTIWAPAIDGYSLMSATLGGQATANKQMVQADYDKLSGGTTTVTFAYMPVAKANFVTHTIKFMMGTQELYSYEKLVQKGTGAVVSYPADAVADMIPGYTYSHTTYNGADDPTAVRDNADATIVYYFVEDVAKITIKFQDASGKQLTQNGNPVPDQELTGYRKGQTVQVAAPVKDGFALVSDLIQDVTLNDTNTEVIFKYAAAGDVTFTLKELNADGTEGSIIAVINGEANKTYDAKAKDGNPLDLSKYGYTYEPSNLTQDPFNVGGSGKVENLDMSQKMAYTVFYTKNLINVEFVPVNKTKLDDAKTTLDDAIKDGTVDNYKIDELHPVTPEKARVGETYKAVAQSFNGWALKDSFSKLYEVKAGDTSLKVYFLYEQKTTGTVIVHYHFGTGADNMGEKLNEYTITAVAGEKLRISAPDYLMDNKYHLRKTNTNPLELTVTENGATVDFYYEANFVIVTTKVFLDGTDNGTHETYEVIKDIHTKNGSTTIYPPDKAGYTLVGITATNANLTNGGTEKLPDEYTNNQLTLTGLTQDAAVNYYYKTTKASEYQTELTVEYKYNGYDLATAKKINANTGEANSIEIPAFDGYTASTYSFTDGSTVKVNGSGINGTTVSVTPAEKTATLTITYTRPDGSVVLPGEGGKIGDNDDIVVKPTDPNNPPTLNPGPDPAKGSATIPDNTTGTVTRPDPDKPDSGKEDIIVPGGTTIDPDGTIHLPKNPDGSDGGEIKPGQKIPDALPDTYVAITYDSNNGSGDVKKEIGKKGELQVKGSLFTHPNNAKFVEWNTSGLGSGTTYAEGKKVADSITLYAKWSARSYTYSATITYKPNGGTPDKDVISIVGHDTDPNLTATLQSSPFQLSGWLFGGWCEAVNGTGKLYQPDATLSLKDKETKDLFAQWYKVNADESITVPGKDGDPNTAGDNATAKGDGKGNNPTRDETTGEITVPKGGSVTLPDGSVIGMPDGGTLKPDGTVIINRPDTDKDGKSDGTITIPGTNNGKPDVKDENGTVDPNAEVFTLTYTINNGENDPDVKVMVVKGDTTSTISNPFTWADHIFLNWMREGDGKEYAAGKDITVTADDTFHAQWAKGVNPDGSIELPGKDGILDGTGDDGTDHAKDNVTVTPADPDHGGSITPQPDGSVKVDDTNGGTVTRPDPANPDNKEEIKVPDGTVVKPDGTIILPDKTEIDPDQRIPDDVTPNNYYVVTYEPGEGSGDVIRQIVEKDTDTTLLGADTFTAPNGKTFDGWLDELDSKHDADSQVAVMKNTTLTAQWKDGTPTPPAPQYSADIVFDSNNGDTATQTVTSSDSKTITRNLDPYSKHFTAPTDWTFMGWSSTKAASQSSTFYEDGAEITVMDGDTLNLYAIIYKVDADTDIITLPGKGGQPDDGDDVTVTPGADADLTVKEGYIEAPAGSEIKQPASNDPIKVIEGSVNVYPDGSVYVPDGSKVQLPDGTTIEGEATIDPDGNPDTDNTKPIQRPDGTIVLPGENGKTGDEDDITIAPAGPNQPAGRIDEDGNVTITNPDGADVNLPGNNPEDVKVPNGTVIKPNGDMTLLYTIRYVDGNGTEIKTATVKPVQRGVPETVEAAVINGYKLNDTATKTASGEVSANLADYTITFTYAKENSGGNNGGNTGGGGGGGGSVSSSFVIKASAGNGGIISPSGNVTVARGKDQSFTINPINGYRISDVIVDGKSVGTVSTYTFDSVKANHTIEVKFAKLNSIVADPETTGVAGWLQTREHIAYLGGYGNGLFGPDDNMTRAQAAQMFYNLLLNKDVDITVNFTDVPADAWYGKAVHTLASLGIIKGIGNDQFAPDRTITRAEFTVIAMRFANVAADVQNPFTDVTESAWYYTAVTSATSYGWINGYSDGTFRPYATITRAEVATIVNRMLNRAADRDFVDSNVVGAFTDVPKTYWGFYAIMEATTSHDHTIDNDGVETWNALK